MSAGPHTELHHCIDGPQDAPVLVLGPSLGTDLHLFEAQVAALQLDYRIVRYDLPGHGESPTPVGPYSIAGMANDVAAMLDRLEIDRFHYAGVSIGGAIGQQLALEHPGRVLSLAVIASSARFADPSSWPRRAETVRENGTEAMVASRTGTWYVHDFAETAEAGRLLAMLRATRAEGYAGSCEAIAGFDVRDRLSEIAIPVLAVAGAEDPATPPAMLQAIADGVRDGRCVTVANSAHLLNVEMPDKVAALLAHHLAAARTEVR